MIAFKKITYLIMAACIACAMSDRPSRADVTDIVNEATVMFYDVLLYDQAWDMIKDLEDPEDPFLYTAKSMMLASGWLSSGFDRCGAIYNAEKAAERDNLVPAMGLLKSLYEGDWIAVAALEGSRIALYYKGYRILRADLFGNALAGFDPKRPLEDAAPYLYLSADLGFPDAQREVERLERDEPGIFRREKYLEAMENYKPIEVYCPPRVYEDGELK